MRVKGGLLWHRANHRTFAREPAGLDEETREAIRRLTEPGDDVALSSAGKLKLSLPILPTVLSYETELGLDVKASLRSLWNWVWS